MYANRTCDTALHSSHSPDQAEPAAGRRQSGCRERTQEVQGHLDVWSLSKRGGKEVPATEFKGITVTFAGDKFTVKRGDEVIQAATQKLDPSKSPKTIDMTVAEGVNKGAVILGIYEISGDTLKVCFDPDGKKRPTQFKSASGSQTLVVHKRVKN